MKNILDNIGSIKETLLGFAEQAVNQEWISRDDYTNIQNGLLKDKITIGVIGQMKHGKSTLMNAMIFGKDVLPMATVPMTATLTVMTYSERKYAEVTFFSHEEWANLETLAAMDEDSNLVKAARDMIRQAEPIRGELPGLLGTKKEIGLHDLLTYAASKGRYSSISKSITIFYPHQRLKSADFVDTPGFNDPVISREEQTKAFIDKADVVIIVLTAGRSFDDKDRSILFDQVRSVGTGKIIVLINKYDLVLDDHGSEQAVLNSVSKKLKEEIVKLEKTDPLLASVFKEGKPLLFSSLFALFGKMDVAETDSQELKEYYLGFKETFPQIKTKADFLKWSKMQALEDQLDELLNKERVSIILRKPSTELIGKIRKSGADIKEDMIVLQQTKEALSKDRGTIEKEIKELDVVGDEIASRVLAVENTIRENVIELCGDVSDFIASERDLILKKDLANMPFRRNFQANESYMNDCKGYVEEKLIDFRSAIERRLKRLGREVYQAYSRQARELDTEITDIANNKIRSNSQAINDLKKSFFDILECQISDVDYQVDVSITGTWGFFFGLSREKIIEETRSKVNSKFNSQVINNLIGPIKQPALDLLSAFETFKSKTITPIITALENAKRSLGEKEKLFKDINPKIAGYQESLLNQAKLLAEIQQYLKAFIEN